MLEDILLSGLSSLAVKFWLRPVLLAGILLGELGLPEDDWLFPEVLQVY